MTWKIVEMMCGKLRRMIRRIALWHIPAATCSTLLPFFDFIIQNIGHDSSKVFFKCQVKSFVAIHFLKISSLIGWLYSCAERQPMREDNLKRWGATVFTWSLNLTLSDEPSRPKGHSYSTTLAIVFNLKSWRNETAMDHIIKLLYYSSNKGLQWFISSALYIQTLVWSLIRVELGQGRSGHGYFFGLLKWLNSNVFQICILKDSSYSCDDNVVHK